MKDLELLNVITQTRDVFGGESLIWRMREAVRYIQGVLQGHPRRNSRSRTDGIFSVAIRVMGSFVSSAWGLPRLESNLKFRARV
jgi:hypothetical protein